MLARPPKKSRQSVPIVAAPIKLDLGCGARRPEPKAFGEGWTGIDIAEGIGADKVIDLTKYPWPYADNSVDAIYTSHFLEHLSGPVRIPFMEECWRILK